MGPYKGMNPMNAAKASQFLKDYPSTHRPAFRRFLLNVVTGQGGTIVEARVTDFNGLTLAKVIVAESAEVRQISDFDHRVTVVVSSQSDTYTNLRHGPLAAAQAACDMAEAVDKYLRGA